MESSNADPTLDEEQKENQPIRTIPTKTDTDVRVAVIGNVDSGKSTLVGVLTRCIQDDGRGSARSYVFNYSHEQANGRTSSISHEIMGFTPDGSQVAPERLTDSKNRTWSYIVDHSSHIVTFLDLCGHEKYLKTTIFGLVGLIPDYAMIVVGANMGLTRMTKEHIGLALALKIPMFFVFTKIDIAPENVYKENINLLHKVLTNPAAGSRLPLYVKDDTDVSDLCNMMEARACPIFTISNVTGEGVNKLRQFIYSLQSRTLLNGVFGSRDEPFEFLIDGVYMVTGVGCVLSGIVKSGSAELNQQIMLGPDKTGTYKHLVIRGIHMNRVPVENAIAGQSVCFNVRPVNKKEQLKRSHIKKGMVLIDKSLCMQTAWEFDAEVVILHHATTIRPNYQPVIHCGVVRQAAKVVSMTKELLRTGDKGLIHFRFMFNPELIHPKMTLLFREGRTKGLGMISQVYPIENSL
ncbi:unnamed protein product [Blepharisma stoltei]|uniref:Tr-type G domain-containing protein n=1 Tax=Blepharisma stoltei TaxID=1481888 RepID=A0AAU9J0D6_9CILI|nr:unnamed protein product [Blepharisma stoltei]